jgi:hypothetical protein
MAAIAVKVGLSEGSDENIMISKFFNEEGVSGGNFNFTAKAIFVLRLL